MGRKDTIAAELQRKWDTEVGGEGVEGDAVEVAAVEGEEEAGEAGGAHGPRVVRTEGRDGAVDWVRQNARPEDVVLVKASRGAALELVAEAIMEETTQ